VPARGSIIVGSKRNRIGVSVRGMDDIRKIPGWIEYGQARFVADFAGRQARVIAEVGPQGETHRLEEGWRGEAFSSTKARVFTNVKYAKAQDRGAFIQAKPGHVLRFPGADGEWAFARFVRIKPKHYIDKALKQRRRLAEEAFRDNMGNLREANSAARRVMGATYNPHLRP
jgi:hypothetical protein